MSQRDDALKHLAEMSYLERQLEIGAIACAILHLADEVAALRKALRPSARIDLERK